MFALPGAIVLATNYVMPLLFSDFSTLNIGCKCQGELDFEGLDTLCVVAAAAHSTVNYMFILVTTTPYRTAIWDSIVAVCGRVVRKAAKIAAETTLNRLNGL